MNEGISKRKRIIIAIPTILITAGFLFLCWYFLPGNFFLFVLIGFAILAMIFDHFAKVYEQRKKARAEQGEQDGRK